MSLTAYKKKRSFEKTPEPSGKIIKSKKGNLIFVIQEHDSSHLHWDLRLEMGGVLKSWAVPKSPIDLKKRGVKRLAINVEDHPLQYADFEGIISEGNYGAGKVKIWDRGKYELIEKDSKKIIFELHGKKLKGKYCLVKTRYGSRPEKSWLWFKL